MKKYEKIIQQTTEDMEFFEKRFPDYELSRDIRDVPLDIHKKLFQKYGSSDRKHRIVVDAGNNTFYYYFSIMFSNGRLIFFSISFEIGENNEN